MFSSGFLPILLGFILHGCFSIKCSSQEKCPSHLPCCSPYGECGTGTICVNRCNPKFSFTPQSCVPHPVLLFPYSLQFPDPGKRLQNTLYWYTDNIQTLKENRFLHFDEFLITPNSDVAKQQLRLYDFTYSGHTYMDPLQNQISLRMPQRTKGSLIASTREFLYGKCSVTLKSAKSRGVITAIVLISEVGDEIDFEFLGTEVTTVQSNFFHLGHLDYTKMKRLPIDIDNTEAWHRYEIDWNEERINWLIDGKIQRTVHKYETWDPQTKTFAYPQTPVRLEIAIWPGGDINLPPGTAEWAGGFIDWNHDPELKTKGYFEATISNILVQPYMNSHTRDIVGCIRKNTNRNRVKIEDLEKITMNYNPGLNNDFTERSIQWHCNEIYYLNGQKSSIIEKTTY